MESAGKTSVLQTVVVVAPYGEIKWTWGYSLSLRTTGMAYLVPIQPKYPFSSKTVSKLPLGNILWSMLSHAVLVCVPVGEMKTMPHVKCIDVCSSSSQLAGIRVGVDMKDYIIPIISSVKSLMAQVGNSEL